MVAIGRRMLIAGGVVVGAAVALRVVVLRHESLPREPGLVGLWTFDEGSGETVHDSSGNGNDGTILPQGLPDGIWGKPPFAGALSLSGRDNNHIHVPASPSLNAIGGAVTVAAHVYPRTLWTPGSAAANPFTAVVQRQWRDVGHPDLYYLGFGLENNVLTYKWHVGVVGSEPAIYALPPGGIAPATGAWVHLCGTYDGRQLVLYVDGVAIGSLAASGPIRSDDLSATRPLSIGGEINGPAQIDADGLFDGYVEEARIYDHALGAAEVAALAAAAKARTSAA